MLVPSKHFLFSKTSLRGLEDVFSGTTFCLPRRPQDLFAISLPKTSPRRLQDVFARRFQDVFKTCLQDVFFKTSSRRLQDILKKTSCNCALKTFWRWLDYCRKRSCHTKCPAVSEVLEFLLSIYEKASGYSVKIVAIFP